MKTRLRLFARLAAAPGGSHAGPRLGSTLNRMFSDLGALKSWVSRGVAALVVGGASLLGCLSALSVFVPAALVPALLLVATILAALAATTPLHRRLVREARVARGSLATHLGDVLPALPTVVSAGRTRREWRRTRTRSLGLARAQVRRARIASLAVALPDAGFPLGVGLLAALYARDAVAPAELLAAVALLGLIAAALRDLARAWSHRIAFVEARRRVLQLLDAPVLSGAPPARALPPGKALALELRDVSYGSIKRLSLRLEPGERVALHDGDGSSRSPIPALATRRCDPHSGHVSIGGQRVAGFAPESLARAVRLVSSTLPLLRASVARNVAYGAFSARDAELAAELCGLDTDTLARRVGGCAQPVAPGLGAVIALARAVAARPGLLIVDDPLFGTDRTATAALRRVLDATSSTVLICVADDGVPPFPVDRRLRADGGELPVTESAGAHAGSRRRNPRLERAPLARARASQSVP